MCVYMCSFILFAAKAHIPQQIESVEIKDLLNSLFRTEKWKAKKQQKKIRHEIQ